VKRSDTHRVSWPKRRWVSQGLNPSYGLPGCSQGINRRDDAADSVGSRTPAGSKIWIDDALGGAARCRLGALRQRGIAALDIAAVDAVGLQADRIVRIIGLGPSGRRHQSRCDRQDRQSRNRHHSLRDKQGAVSRPCPRCPSHRDLRCRFHHRCSARNQTVVVVRSQFTFARSRRAGADPSTGK